VAGPQDGLLRAADATIRLGDAACVAVGSSMRRFRVSNSLKHDLGGRLAAQ
jgi:hypothetical protein